MSADIAELGLRLDANGFVSGVDRAIRSLDGLAEHGGRTHQKLERFTTATAYSMSSLASGGAVSLGRLATSFESLAFAFGPVVGGIGLGVGAIITLFDQLEDKSEHTAAAIGRNFARMGEEGIRAQLAAARLQERTYAQDILRYQPEKTGYAAYDFMMEHIPGGGNLPEEMRKEMERRTNAVHEAERALQDYNAEAAKDEAKRAAEAHRREVEKIAEAWRAIHERQDATIDAMMARLPTATEAALALVQRIREQVEAEEQLDAALADVATKQDVVHVAMEKMKRDWDDVIGKLRTYLVDLSAVDKIVSDWKTDRQIGYGIASGVVGAVLGRQGGVLGAIGQGVSGVIGAAATGNPYAMAAAGVQGLVGGILSLGDSARQAAQQIRDMQRWLDQIRVETGHLTSADATEREIHREFEERTGFSRAQREEIVRSGGLHGLPFHWSAEQRAAFDEINRLEDELVAKRREEADAINEINSALRNAPAGFFIERYLNDAINPSSLMRPVSGGLNPVPLTGSLMSSAMASPPLASSSSSSSLVASDLGWDSAHGATGTMPAAGGWEKLDKPTGEIPANGMTVVVHAGGIIVRGDNPDVAFKNFMEGLRRHATRTVGTFGKLSQALDVA